MQNYALQFGQGGWLAADSNPVLAFGTGDFTVEAWVKSLAGGTVVARKGTEGGQRNGGFLLVANGDGTIKFATDNGSGFFEVRSGVVGLLDGTWHHVAAVRQGASLSLYLDGAALSTTSGGNAVPPLDVTNDRPLTIGATDQQQEPFRFFTGLIAEVRVWNGARSVADIQYWRSFKLPPDAPGLVGYWAADFGLMADFSTSRLQTRPSGMVSTTTDGPPVLGRAEIPSLFLFAGQYATATKFGGASGQWSDSDVLSITAAGIPMLGSTRIQGATFQGPGLTWPLAGNPCGASVTFLLDSSDPYYWPSGPQTAHCFQGAMQPSGGGSGPLDYRGALLPERELCGLILSAGTGRIVTTTAGGAPGAALVLGDKTAGQHEHFCVFGDQHLEFMHTGAVVAANGPLQAGTQLVLRNPGYSGQDAAWSFGPDGTIRPIAASSLAIGLSQDTPQRLVLVTANANDATQRWLTLALAQFLWNGQPNVVLSATGQQPPIYDQVVGQPKADGRENQLWYLVRQAVVSDYNAAVLTVVGPATSGARVGLAPFADSDAQRFMTNGAQLVHVPSGLIVRLDAAGNAVLAPASDTSAAAQWRVGPRDSVAAQRALADAIAPLAAREAMAPMAAVDDMVDYTIWITTADTLFAGTDDRVEIALVGANQTTDIIELKTSETHSDPFERGQTDRFTVRLRNVGLLQGIYFRYGQNVWFYRDRWVVSSVSVYDPTTLRSYSNSHVGNGAQFEMPAQTTIYFDFTVQQGGQSTMAIGKAPTQDNTTRGWVDHTWGVVRDGVRTTYFDSGGGHDGQGAVNDIVTTSCSLNDSVIMATSFPIDPAHPYQPVYGHDDVNGAQTCGVRASGFRNWDGQCHQMVNRLLYISTPLRTLADASDKRPTGYGLTCLLWGPYGVGFDSWCTRVGVRPPDPAGDAIFDYVQRYLGNRQQTYRVMYHDLTMQAALQSDPEYPLGPGVKAFFRSIHAEGISNTAIANLVCLPEDKVVLEEQ